MDIEVFERFKLSLIINVSTQLGGEVVVLLIKMK